MSVLRRAACVLLLAAFIRGFVVMDGSPPPPARDEVLALVASGGRLQGTAVALQRINGTSGSVLATVANLSALFVDAQSSSMTMLSQQHAVAVLATRTGRTCLVQLAVATGQEERLRCTTGTLQSFYGTYLQRGKRRLYTVRFDARRDVLALAEVAPLGASSFSLRDRASLPPTLLPNVGSVLQQRRCLVLGAGAPDGASLVNGILRVDLDTLGVSAPLALPALALEGLLAVGDALYGVGVHRVPQGNRHLAVIDPWTGSAVLVADMGGELSLGGGDMAPLRLPGGGFQVAVSAGNDTQWPYWGLVPTQPGAPGPRFWPLPDDAAGAFLWRRAMAPAVFR